MIYVLLTTLGSAPACDTLPENKHTKNREGEKAKRHSETAHKERRDKKKKERKKERIKKTKQESTSKKKKKKKKKFRKWRLFYAFCRGSPLAPSSSKYQALQYEDHSCLSNRSSWSPNRHTALRCGCPPP